MVNEPDSNYQRLENQIKWYDNKSISNQRWYKSLKLVEIIAASIIPFVAPYNALITAILGVIVVILEGAQQLYQFQYNWVSYRSTCETLRHEKYLFIENVGPYEDMEPETAKKLLAQRVEALISTEHARWFLNQKKSQKETNEKLKDIRQS